MTSKMRAPIRHLDPLVLQAGFAAYCSTFAQFAMYVLKQSNAELVHLLVLNIHAKELSAWYEKAGHNVCLSAR